MKRGVKSKRFSAKMAEMRISVTCVEYREEVQNKRKMITGETSKLGSCRARVSWFLNAGRRICVCYVGKKSCSITSRRKV